VTDPVPPGFRTITPVLAVEGAAEAIEFYKAAFGAEEQYRMAGPDGRIAHATFSIGDSTVMISDPFPGTGGPTRSGFYLYVADCDAAHERAVQAGADSRQEPVDAFWGDRYSRVADRWGNTWDLATHTEDVSSEEMDRRAEEWMSSMPQGG
jgi:PhnB protein